MYVLVSWCVRRIKRLPLMDQIQRVFPWARRKGGCSTGGDTTTCANSERLDTVISDRRSCEELSCVTLGGDF